MLCQLEVREREAWKQQHLKALLSPAQLGPSCYSVTVAPVEPLLFGQQPQLILCLF